VISFNVFAVPLGLGKLTHVVMGELDVLFQLLRHTIAGQGISSVRMMLPSYLSNLTALPAFVIPPAFNVRQIPAHKHERPTPGLCRRCRFA
jgi:hypothetical protein